MSPYFSEFEFEEEIRRLRSDLYMARRTILDLMPEQIRKAVDTYHGCKSHEEASVRAKGSRQTPCARTTQTGERNAGVLKLLGSYLLSTLWGQCPDHLRRRGLRLSRRPTPASRGLLQRAPLLGFRGYPRSLPTQGRPRPIPALGVMHYSCGELVLVLGERERNP